VAEDFRNSRATEQRDYAAADYNQRLSSSPSGKEIIQAPFGPHRQTVKWRLERLVLGFLIVAAVAIAQIFELGSGQ